MAIIEGCKVAATIDTGATSCFMARETAEVLKKDLNYQRKQIEAKDVILADGTTVNITKSTMLRVTFGNHSTDLPFSIMPQFKENIILGLEFLKQFFTTLNYAGLIVKLDKSSIVPFLLRIWLR